MEPHLAGTSKASVNEVIRYFRKLVELRFTRGSPRFMYFLLVGLAKPIASLINLSTLLLLALFTEEIASICITSLSAIPPRA